jgi:hypothetical protein
MLIVRLTVKNAVTVITVERSVHAALAAGAAQHWWIHVSGPAVAMIYYAGALLQAGKSRVAITSPEAHHEAAKELPIVYGIFMDYKRQGVRDENVFFICVQTLPPDAAV